MLTRLLPIVIIMSISIIFFGYKRFRGKLNNLQLFYVLLFCCYISNLIAITFFPFPDQRFLIRTMIQEHLAERNNLIPFRTIISTFMTNDLLIPLKQIGGNILLFVPLGFSVPLFFGIKSNRRVIVIGFVVSLIIECGQYICSYFIGYTYRSSDIDDIIINTLGTVVGLVIFKCLYKYLKQYDLLLK